MATKTFKDNKLRVPPQNIESEKALLGSIMLKPDTLHDILDTINEDVFYAEKHRLIFMSMLDLFNKHEPIDLLSLSTKLKENNRLDGVGGNTYLTELVDSVPSSANINHYADIVHRKRVLRNIISVADKISAMGYDESKDLSELLDNVEKKVYEATNVGTAQKFVGIKQILPGAFERIDKLNKEGDGGLRGVPTGFPGLDNKLAGFQPSDMVILAARPSMGKTSLALDIARHTAVKYGSKVGIFSLEMSSQQLVDRMLSAQSSIDSWKLRTGKLNSDEDFEKLQNAMEILSKASIFIDDTPGANVLTMRSVARKLKSNHGLDLIIVDYLQLIHPTKNYDSMVNQVTEISRALKDLARELDVPVLALSQLSRAVEQRGGKPRLSDLRDSGSIEQDADVVMFIHRDDKLNENSDKPGIAEILIEKHRNGPTGQVDLFFDDKKTSFVSIDVSEHGDGDNQNGGGDDFDSF